MEHKQPVGFYVFQAIIENRYDFAILSGIYSVILDESHFKDLLNQHVTPPPALVSFLADVFGRVKFMHWINHLNEYLSVANFEVKSFKIHFFPLSNRLNRFCPFFQSLSVFELYHAVIFYYHHHHHLNQSNSFHPFPLNIIHPLTSPLSTL